MKKLFMVSHIKSLSQCNLSDGIRDVTKGQGPGISSGYYEQDSQKIDPKNTLQAFNFLSTDCIHPARRNLSENYWTERKLCLG